MPLTLSDVFRELTGGIDEAYTVKYVHPIPDAPVVDRKAYFVEHCKGKRVLSLGASGKTDEAIKAVASEFTGIDKSGDDVLIHDLDIFPEVITDFIGKIDLVVCGEILEHLSNPGRLLGQIRLLSVPVLISCPNAMTTVGRHWLQQQCENVNVDHVAWYSYRTLRTLVERHGFTVKEWSWYNGKPIFAEGVIFLLE